MNSQGTNQSRRLSDLTVFIACSYQPSNMVLPWDYSPGKDHRALLDIDQVTWFSCCRTTATKWNKRYSRWQKIMSKMTVLLILVWNVSVNITFMVLHAVHIHFRRCGIGLLKLASSLEYQWNCLPLYFSPLSIPGFCWAVIKKPKQEFFFRNNESIYSFGMCEYIQNYIVIQSRYDDQAFL